MLPARSNVPFPFMVRPPVPTITPFTALVVPATSATVIRLGPLVIFWPNTRLPDAAFNVTGAASATGTFTVSVLAELFTASPASVNILPLAEPMVKAPAVPLKASEVML